VKRMGRGERGYGCRGGEGSGSRGIRGNNADQWDPDEQDPPRYPADDEDEPSCTGNEEYIWPEIEDDPDD